VDSVLDMLNNDPTIRPEIVANHWAVRGLHDGSPNNRFEIQTSRAVTTLLLNFLVQFYPPDSEKSYEAFIGPFTMWVSTVKAPLTVVVAEHGIVKSTLGGWSDLGASHISSTVKVHYISGVGHFGLFGDKRVAQILTV